MQANYFGSTAVKEIFTPSKTTSTAASSLHENKSQMAFRSGLRSPTDLKAANSDLTKSMDHSLLTRHAATTASNKNKPWVPSNQVTRTSPSRNATDLLSRSWQPSSSSKGSLATNIARSGMTSYSPVRASAASPSRSRRQRIERIEPTHIHDQEPNQPPNQPPNQQHNQPQNQPQNQHQHQNQQNQDNNIAPVVPVGEARLSQLCREDKAKVAKLIAQVTKLRHEVSNHSQSESNDSLVLDASSSSSLSAAALKVQEKLEHEVTLAQQRLQVLQDDNKKLNGNTELIRSKYARSLEMLKQYQDRLVKLSEEKEDANNASRVMQASESATSSRLIDLEKELRNTNEKLFKQKELVEMHATIEEKQETRVRDLESKLAMANRVVKESKTNASKATTDQSSNDNNKNLNNNNNNIDQSHSVTSPDRNKSSTSTSKYASPYSQNGGSNLKRPRSKSPVRAIQTNAVSRLTELNQIEQQDAMTPRTQARKRLTEVTKEVVTEIENELEKAQRTAEELKRNVIDTNTTAGSIAGSIAGSTAGTASAPTSKKIRKKPTKKEQMSQLLQPISYEQEEQVPTIHSIAHVQKIYGATPQAVAHMPTYASRDNHTNNTNTTKRNIAPPLSKSMSPDRSQFLKSSSRKNKKGKNKNNRSSGNRSSNGSNGLQSSNSILISSSLEQKGESNLHEHALAKSSKEDLMQELHRAQDALALLKLEQSKLDLDEDTSEPQIASPERPESSNTATMGKQQRRRRRRPRKKFNRIDPAFTNTHSISPPSMHVSVSPKLSDSINFYDGTSLLDVIEAVEDHGNGNLSLSSIGFEDDDLDGMSVNTSMDRGSPTLYIAAAPRPGKKSKGRRKRKNGESSSASVLWSSVGKYLNNDQSGRPRSSRGVPRAIVEQHGGREGDYWGAFPNESSRTPNRFSQKWREEKNEGSEEEEEERLDVVTEQNYREEYYEDSIGGASSKGEPVYR